jgi:hypothetical protein
MHDVRVFLERMASEASIPSEEGGAVVRRARRHVGATLVGGALAMALVITGGVAALDAVRAWNRTTPLVSEPPPTPTGSPSIAVTGRFGEDDLRDLVLRASDRPTGHGLRHDPSFSEFNGVTSVASTLDVSTSALAQAGLVTAYFNGFLSDAWYDTSAPPKERVDLVSYAILFPDAEAAQAGFELIAAGPATASGWRSEPVEDLGEEARASRGLWNDVPTTAIVWRVDNVVLFIASQGYGGAIPLDEIRSLAELMDARAA